ncbi:MAG: hypothetical protein R6V77_00855, partial [Candidatus Cloacimonadaceae bacterium]
MAALKSQMWTFGIGSQIRKNGENFELREPQSPYNAVFDAEKSDIEVDNLRFWNVESIISVGCLGPTPLHYIPKGRALS